MKFALIRDQLQGYPVGLSCQVLGLSRSGYYAWRGRPVSGQRRRRDALAVRVRATHQEHRGRYGSPRIHRALRARGEAVSENTVAKIMREEGIGGKTKRKFVPRTTDSVHDHPVAPNVLNRQFEATAPNRVWLSDVTYIRTDEGWLYLAGVLDLFSRKIVGWSMGENLRAELAGDALKMAVRRRRAGSGLLHHSDRGIQYACDEYQGLLARHRMETSMSGKGNCYDNAVMESFWATLKTELVHDESYATREQARRSIAEYIEVFHNRKRLHSSLGYVSPEAFEVGHN